jgi:hypothetical protein
MSSRAFLTAAAAGLLLPASAEAARRIYSYEPANAPARVLAEAGFTFIFDDGRFGGQRVRTVLSNHANAEAPLRPASAKELGADPQALVGGQLIERDFYEVTSEAEGGALARAACPGAERTWLSFGDLKRMRDLTVQVFGRDPGGKPRHCATLRFAWKGEWRLHAPPGAMRATLGPRD